MERIGEEDARSGEDELEMLGKEDKRVLGTEDE